MIDSRSNGACMLGLSGRRRNASLTPLVAVNADHKSNIPLGEIWQSKGAKLCDDFHSRLEEEERIRSGFRAVSGYHTLDTASCPALSWLRMTNNNKQWYKHSIMSPIPGSTHLMFIAALFQGPSAHKESWFNIVNGAALTSALILSSTLGFLLDPPELVADPDMDWIVSNEAYGWLPLAYNFSLAISIGMSVACIIIAFYIQILTSVCVRDSDWLRMMYLRGDCVSVWLLIFFFLSLIPLLPAIAVMWIPTIVSIENVSGRLTMVLILIPIIIGPLFVFCFLGLNGGLDWYLLMKGETLKIKTGNEEKIRNDSPQLDWIIECFEAKIDHAKRLIEVDHEQLNNRHTCDMVNLRMPHMSIPQRVHQGSA